jgi:hypothetical protein
MSGAAQDRPQLRIEERSDDDGVLRLALGGEPEVAVVDAVDGRLIELERASHRVRLDLAELEIDTHISKTVRRVIELAGVRSRLWRETG